MKHPRAPELAKIVAALEATGRPVQAVEVRWEQVDGREVPVWRIVLVGEHKPDRVSLG